MSESIEFYEGLVSSQVVLLLHVQCPRDLLRTYQLSEQLPKMDG